MLKFKLLNFDMTDLVFLTLSGIVLEILSFQKVSTNNFFGPKVGKRGQKNNYLICNQLWEIA
jgi:hypothetical protein